MKIKFETLEKKELFAIDALVDHLSQNVHDAVADNVAPYEQHMYSEDAIHFPGAGYGKMCTAGFPQFCFGDDWWDENFFLAEYDFTGVNYGPKSGTVVAPDIVLSAEHHGNLTSTSSPLPDYLYFYDQDGVEYQRSIVGHMYVPGSGDLRVNKLDSPLPAEIKVYSLPDPDFHADDYRLANAVYMDQDDNVYIGKLANYTPADVSDVNDQYQRLIKDTVPYVDEWEGAVGGDSSHPTFILNGNGELVLASVMHKGPSPAGPDLGDPVVQANLQSAMATLGSTYSLQTVEWGVPADWEAPAPASVDAIFASFEEVGGRRTRTVRQTWS